MKAWIKNNILVKHFRNPLINKSDTKLGYFLPFIQLAIAMALHKIILLRNVHAVNKWTGSISHI